VITEPAEVTITGTRRDIDSVECAAAVLRLTGLTVSVSNQVPLDPRDAAGRAIGGVTVLPPTATVNAKIRQDLFPRQLVTDVRLQGRPAAGYAVTSVRVEPPLASVVGPLDTVGSLNSIPTEVIDIEGAKSDIVRAVALEIPPGVSSGDRRSVVTITIQPVRGPGSVGVAPRIMNLDAGLTATLNTPVVAVLITGPLPDVLALKPADVTVTVDATGLGPGTHRLEPKVVVPPNLALDGTSPDRVEIAIGSQP
jgi:YbbR domain-containing protein